jgi:hypothetical protein
LLHQPRFGKVAQNRVAKVESWQTKKFRRIFIKKAVHLHVDEIECKSSFGKLRLLLKSLNCCFI